LRITSKGQITIPIAIREKMGFMPYTEVEFDVEGETLRLKKLDGVHGRGRALIVNMRGKATAGMSTEEIMNLTRGWVGQQINR